MTAATEPARLLAEADRYAAAGFPAQAAAYRDKAALAAAAALRDLLDADTRARELPPLRTADETIRRVQRYWSDKAHAEARA